MTEYSPRNQEFLSKLTEIILSNLENENFGVKELARESGISQYNLRQRLHLLTNKTINQFIRETRLHKALEMLQNGVANVSEIAYKTGFSSPAYFNTCFHDYFGFPPGQVKKGDLITAEGRSPIRESKEKPERSDRRTLFLILSGIVILAFLGYLCYSIFFKATAAESKSIFQKEKSIAVLPFKNLSSSVEDGYFIDGVMEEVLTDLSRIHDLRVISRTSVEQFRDLVIPAYEIAKKLKVKYIVEGSGQKYANTFRLRVQLIDAAPDRHLWAESYEQEISDIKDIFKIQSQIAQSIAVKLQANMTPEEKQLIERTPTTNLTAYDFYLRGRDELEKYPWPEYNPEAVKRAETLFIYAINYDSTFARAYASLADALWLKHDRDSTITETIILNKYLDSILVLTELALKYDNQLSDAYFVRGGYYLQKGFENKAVEEWDKALKFNPNDFRPLVSKGSIDEELDLCRSLEEFQKAASLTHGPRLTYILRRIGQNYYEAGFPEEGNHALLEALKLDGDSSGYFNNVFNFAAEMNGEINKSIEYYKKIYSGDTTNATALIHLGFYNSLTGNYQESLKYYKIYISILKVSSYSNPWTKLMMEYLIGYAFKENGYRKESDYYFDKSIETCSKQIISKEKSVNRYFYYRLAGIYAYRGDKRKAYEYLRRFNAGPIFGLGEVTLIKSDPLFNNIRNEPEFRMIVRNVESKYQAEHERVTKWLKKKGRNNW